MTYTIRPQLLRAMLGEGYEDRDLTKVPAADLMLALWIRGGPVRSVSETIAQQRPSIWVEVG